ncbi:MAG: HlyD family efflux transporter periplasmic adaptor subunit [Pseudomonadota bacterium]
MTVFSRLMILPPALLGAILVWQATQSGPTPLEVVPSERRMPVAYVAAVPRDYAPSVSGYGTVAPARVWTAVAEVAGPVAHLHPGFVRGGFIAEGEVLIAIAAEDYVIALDHAEADLKAAEAQLEEIRLSKRTTAAALAIEREALALAEADLARTERLASSGTVSAAVVDGRRRDVLAQRAKVQTQENALALLPAQIAALDAAADAARATRDAAALDLERTEIIAPFDARVAQAEVEIGQFVGAGTIMGTLDGFGAAEIDVQVSQGRIRALAGLTGDAFTPSGHAVPAPVAPFARSDLRRAVSPGLDGDDADGGRARLSARVYVGRGEAEGYREAEIARLSDTVSPETRSVGVIVRVDKPYGVRGEVRRPTLMKGMFVRVKITAPTVGGVILLPRAAILNGQVMLAGADDRLVYASVAPVFTADGIAVLEQGALPAGARVITQAPSAAVEGLSLAPVPDIAAMALLAAAASGDDL